MIDDRLVEEVRERADIVEIVGEHTRLRRSGRTFRGPCPLHGGEGPNFSVDPAKGLYKCFVCGEGGTVYTFLQKHLGLSFPEAVRSVAARVGVEIPDRREDRPVIDPNDRYHEANAFAARWFQAQLWDEAAGGEARAYLERRGISEEVARRFGLGWAPEAWAALMESAAGHGIPQELLLELGLLKPSRTRREPYDAFRGRLIFPIEDLGGRVIAFGGRVIGAVEEHVPKYLNSPESPVYHKGEVLYGLRWSRPAIRRAGEALVVEGYMDYVSLASHGVENAVAPLGTALTQAQAELIARYAPRVVLLYDSDAAGLKATFRSGDELLRAGVEVQVASLPEGEDPDSLVRRDGGDALRRYLRDAVDVLERKIQILERKGFFRSISGTRRAIDALLPTIRATSDEVMREVYLSRIAERSGVAKEAIEREARSGARKEEVAAAPRPTPGAPPRRREEAPLQGATLRRRAGAERNLILLMLQDGDWLERVAARVGPADFRDPLLRTLYEDLVRLHAEEDELGDGELLERVDPEAVPVLQEMISDPERRNIGAPSRFLEDSVRDIETTNMEARLIELGLALEGAPQEKREMLLREQMELRLRMQKAGLSVDVHKLRRARNAPGGAG